MSNKKRPVFLNLMQIHMPLMAVLSIGHRITGILLFLLIPYVIYLFDLSLSGEKGFLSITELTDCLSFKVAALLALWGFAHHFFAGIRYLLIDLDIGVELKSGRRGAMLVFAAGTVVVIAGVILI